METTWSKQKWPKQPTMTKEKNISLSICWSMHTFQLFSDHQCSLFSIPYLISTRYSNGWFSNEKENVFTIRFQPALFFYIPFLILLGLFVVYSLAVGFILCLAIHPSLTKAPRWLIPCFYLLLPDLLYPMFALRLGKVMCWSLGWTLRPSYWVQRVLE